MEGSQGFSVFECRARCRLVGGRESEAAFAPFQFHAQPRPMGASQLRPRLPPPDSARTAGRSSDSWHVRGTRGGTGGRRTGADSALTWRGGGVRAIHLSFLLFHSLAVHVLPGGSRDEGIRRAVVLMASQVALRFSDSQIAVIDDSSHRCRELALLVY